MAKRNHKIDLRLNDEEFEKLKHDVEQSGWSREKYLRALIMNSPMKARPQLELVQMLKQIQLLNNNMNQIAAKANSLGYVDELEYRRCADEVMKLCGEIQKEYAKKGVKGFGND